MMLTTGLFNKGAGGGGVTGVFVATGGFLEGRPAPRLNRKVNAV